MPVILKKTVLNEAVIGLWELKESEDFFLDRLDLTPGESEQLSEIKGKRRLHWLCSRYLLHLMTKEGQRRACIKDRFGKPHLEDSEEEISFSHSDDLVAVALGPRLVGVDIQIRVEKIKRISYKFINEAEELWVKKDEIKRLHIIWGAKEAGFKAYGRKEVDFKLHQHYKAGEDNNFELYFDKGNGVRHTFDGAYEQWGDYTLVYLMETTTDD